MRKWTKEQLMAINTRDKTLLVSAAAGSGKTATLTERIISSVLDKDSPKDIGRMLIVTFTNAAVRELRDRISAAIRECAVNNPTDARLEEQLLRVKDARIVTINSFCNDILRSSAEAVGLPPNYRIAEPAEAALVAKEVLEGMILCAFEGELSEVCAQDEFAEVAEGLVGVKNEGELADVLTQIYDKLSSEVGGVEVLSSLIRRMTLGEGESVDSLPIIEYIKNKLRDMLSAKRDLMLKARDTLANEGASEKTLAVFSSDIDNIDRALGCDSYIGISSSLTSAVHERMSPSRTPSYQWAKKIRDGYVNNHKKYTTLYFALNEDDLRYLLRRVCKNAEIIYKFLKKFDEVFLEEKRTRGIVEFRDAERYALKALTAEDGGASPLAKELSRKYSDIYIDEYQDVNALQAGVFEAISRADNCFMVGDIKQSIYGFRSAKPELFAAKKKSYPELGSEGDSPRASLFMSKNFRCDKNIIDFTNGIFDKLFSAFSESIGYTPKDRLEFAKVYGEGELPVSHIPEIHIIEYAAEGKELEEDSEMPNADAMLNEDISAMTLSAEAVADLVDSLVGKRKLANGRLIRPSDIAILTRSVKSAEAEYTSALERRGYECDVTESRDFFLNEEVLLALSLLNAIDNPQKDVYLSAIMTSPLYGFSFDELFMIRREGGGDTLYSSLCEYSRLHPEDEKCLGMISTLSKYRKISEGMSVDKLIALLYKETGLLTLAAANGKRDNLMLLHSHARRYEKSSFKGLYSFISYVNSVIENDGEFSSSSEEEGIGGEKIKILTYHRSKGLEFPVVILTETQKRLHVADRGAAARVKLASDFGFSVGVREPSGLAMLKNPISDIIELYNRDKELEEALRVLYVALTRARERLYIFGSANDANTLLDRADDTRENFSKYTVGELTNLLDIILACRNMGRIVCNGTQIPDSEGKINEGVISEKSEISTIEFESDCKPVRNFTEAKAASDAENGASELVSRFLYEYPFKFAPSVPEKLAVSVLSPAVLDGNEEVVSVDALMNSRDGVMRAALPDGLSEDSMQTLPEFMTGKKERISAERGIATHTFMQFCDFERLHKLGASGELSCLIDGEFISREDSELVRLAEIDKFRESELFSEIREARRVYRELRFNVKLPASLFTKDERGRLELRDSLVLVQGVIDCVIEGKDGSLHLIDYKTDRLTEKERENPELGALRLIEKHRLQLSYYSLAVESIFGKAPRKVGIYSMHLGREIEINPSE